MYRRWTLLSGFRFASLPIRSSRSCSCHHHRCCRIRIHPTIEIVFLTSTTRGASFHLPAHARRLRRLGGTRHRGPVATRKHRLSGRLLSPNDGPAADTRTECGHCRTQLPHAKLTECASTVVTTSTGLGLCRIDVLGFLFRHGRSLPRQLVRVATSARNQTTIRHRGYLANPMLRKTKRRALTWSRMRLSETPP